MIKTQYQNLVRGYDIFYDVFYIPENVYIIGTMNDIDRSVDSMDFAFRRRFTFIEITAKESQSMLDDDKAWKDSPKPDVSTLKELKNRMDNLNDKIWLKTNENKNDDNKSLEGFSSSYHIGAAYFLKLAKYKNDQGKYDFDKLWDYHLKGLLQEYLRGSEKADDILTELRNAFNNNSKNEPTKSN